MIVKKTLAERVDKKHRAMDKKYYYGKMKTTDNRKESKTNRRQSNAGHNKFSTYKVEMSISLKYV